MNKNFLPIDGELTRLTLCLERAQIIMQDIAEEYFKYGDNHTTDEARFTIQYEYPRYSVFSDIVFDYLIQAQEQIIAIRAYGEGSKDV